MSAPTTARVMLVEDHLSFRQSLAFLLSREPDLEVVAQAGSLAEARELLASRLDVAVIAVVLLLLVLELLAVFVAWFWPCEWPWQPFGAFNPYCPGAD
jgi:hypothetical protein